MCMYVVICKIDHCIHIHWCIVMGLGHNDPWVESHMWPQQTWGQRSSRGQWPLVQVFGKKGQCIHILWCIFKSSISMSAKVCDRESRRDSWLENRLVLSTYLWDLSQHCLMRWGGEGYGLKKGSSYMNIIVWKTLFQFIASCEENKDQNWLSVPANFFNNFRGRYTLIPAPDWWPFLMLYRSPGFCRNNSITSILCLKRRPWQSNNNYNNQISHLILFPGDWDLHPCISGQPRCLYIPLPVADLWSHWQSGLETCGRFQGVCLKYIPISQCECDTLRGYCTPDQFCDCLCIFLKNYNTLVTNKISFL